MGLCSVTLCLCNNLNLGQFNNLILCNNLIEKGSKIIVCYNSKILLLLLLIIIIVVVIAVDVVVVNYCCGYYS